MHRVLVILAACGGSAPGPVTPSNRAVPSDAVELEAEAIEGRHEIAPLAVQRQQAIEQARAAGILGSKKEDVAGPLDKASIKAAVRSRLMSIQLCYEAQLLDKPELHGTTLTEFTIGADGMVLDAAARGFDAAVDTCITDVIKKIVFPKPAGPRLAVRYPFTFKPAS